MRQAVKHANLKELHFAAIISVRQKQNVWPVYKVVWQLSILTYFYTVYSVQYTVHSILYILQQSLLTMLEWIFLY